MSTHRSLVALAASISVVLGGAGYALADQSGSSPNGLAPASVGVVAHVGNATAQVLSPQEAAAIVNQPSASMASAHASRRAERRRLRALRSALRYLMSVRAHPRRAHTASAFGCNEDVCINLNGSGLHVNWWQVTGYMYHAFCAYDNYWGPPTSYLWSAPRKCSSGPAYYVGTTDDIDFSGNVEVCNTVVWVPGKPCEYVHR